MKWKHFLYSVCASGLFAACQQNNGAANTVFTSMRPDETGIHFQNNITDTDTLNILDYLYYYNGGGVAIGDINNDGLADIYFTSNQGSNKLYINEGNLRFTDITEKAGVAGTGNWKTGVTLADVNGDGFLDIYVCEVGNYKNLQGHNELFINNGVSRPGAAPTFTERAHEYGLDVTGFNTQAVFFDYDHDGDLDMFLVNHSVHSNKSYGDSSMRRVKDSYSGDKLFRNDRDNTGQHFVEVTEAAGIYSSVVGYGLNVAVADVNNDGWPDIYVSNDFHENDYYYVNNHNGTFSEINRQAFGHESRFSMGSAIADMNNDGWQDIITLDMLPSEEKPLKSAAGDDPLDIYNFKFSFGYYHQYSRNCFQLNTGGGKKFSDIALYAGIAATDWSWSPLAADFDNDGIKDLFISNGILRRPNDLDFIKYYSGRKPGDTSRSADKAAIDKMPEAKLTNYFFKGTDSLRFTDKSKEWGFTEPGFSNGAACADLDNDGDLDIVVNRMNAPAAIYRNNSRQQNKQHYLDIQLKGDAANPFAIGATCIIHSHNTIQTQYLSATKGFESASIQYLHFGTGKDSVIDSMQVIWPNGQSQWLTAVHCDQRLTITFSNAAANTNGLSVTSADTATLFTDVTAAYPLPYQHHENDFNDFNAQLFIPHMISTQGPKMAVADINNDGLEDFYVCGAKGQPGMMFLQTASGAFNKIDEPAFENDVNSEQVNALFFDADGDGDKDLYIVTGGNETEKQDSAIQDKLYLNDGKGKFSKSTGLPIFYGNKSVAIAADMDHDGDLDLFIGGRVVANNYGAVPESYLLLNDGKGRFSIAADKLAPGLSHCGMVTDAVWTDIDKDGWQDLVIVGEWMPISIYKNEHGNLVNYTAQAGLQSSDGWWTTIHAADLNGDGVDDLLVGNWGENSKLHASTQYPLVMYLGDPDNNGSVDQLLTIEKNGKYYTFLGKDELEKQLPALLRKKNVDYASFAGQTVEQIFGERLNAMKRLTAHQLSSVALLSKGQGQFVISRLPAQTQFSPVFSFLTDDFNADGKTDIIASGNFYGVVPYEGRYDAGFAPVLLQNAASYDVLTPLHSGLREDFEDRDMKAIHRKRRPTLYAFVSNNGTIRFYELTNKPHRSSQRAQQ